MIWLKKYMQDFSCLAEKCPDHCCQGWNIELQAFDVHNLHRAGFGDVLQVQRNKNKNIKSEALCQISMTDRKCGALQDGRCGVQSRVGHDSIPLICASYPRAFYRYSSKESPLLPSKLHEEVHGFLSCAGVARCIWNGEGDTWMENSDPHLRIKLADDFTSSGLYARKCSYIRNHIQILLQSNLSIAQKMSIVGSAVRFSPAFFHHSSTKDETHRIVDELQKWSLEPQNIPVSEQIFSLREQLFDVLFNIYVQPPPVNYQRSQQIHKKALEWLSQHRDEWIRKDSEMLDHYANNFLRLYQYDWLERPYMLVSNLVEHELCNQIRQNLLRLYLCAHPKEDISLLMSSMERLLSHSKWLSDISQIMMRRPIPIVEQLQSFYRHEAP